MTTTVFFQPVTIIQTLGAGSSLVCMCAESDPRMVLRLQYHGTDSVALRFISIVCCSDTTSPALPLVPYFTRDGLEGWLQNTYWRSCPLVLSIIFHRRLQLLSLVVEVTGLCFQMWFTWSVIRVSRISVVNSKTLCCLFWWGNLFSLF